jgi:hypothetical protein
MEPDLRAIVMKVGQKHKEASLQLGRHIVASLVEEFKEHGISIHEYEAFGTRGYTPETSIALMWLRDELELPLHLAVSRLPRPERT